MKILQVHNTYTFPGGEDSVAVSEAAMLRAFGHEVIEYRRSNKELKRFGLWKRLCFYLWDIYFSRKTYDEVRGLIAREKPDVAHFHNTFFLIGPAAYQACFDEGIPVVQTLHNYRFLCAAATFFRQGKPCEDCLSFGRRSGIVNRCWHASFWATYWMTNIIKEYERRNILKKITRFIALSDFSRQKFIDAGWAAERIIVKPNFLEKDPGCDPFKGEYILYVGALQSYKGVKTLLKAWGSRSWPIPLKIVGSGPMEKEYRSFDVPNVEWLGQKTQEEVYVLLKKACCLVVPSECYENFPRVIIEAYACGIPVVASRLGAMEGLVEDGQTGLLFEAGNAKALAAAIEKISTDVVSTRKMGENAPRVFEEHYTAAVNCKQLIGVYRQAMQFHSTEQPC